MTLTSEVRSQFTVFVLCPNVDLGASLKASVVQEGYDTYLFLDPDELLLRLRENPCHVLVFTLDSLVVPVAEFVNTCLEISHEIRLLPLAPLSELPSMLNLRHPSVAVPLLQNEGAVSLLPWSVDEICQSLYLVFQNEQVLEAREQALAEVTEVENQMAQLRTQQSSQFVEMEDSLKTTLETNQGLQVGEELAKYGKATSKEEVLSLFFRELEAKFSRLEIPIKALFFKYLPTVQSFVAMQGLGLDLDSIRGVGGRLVNEESHDPEGFFAKGALPYELKMLLNELVGRDEPQMQMKSLYISIRDQVDGLFVLWGSSPQIKWQVIQNEFAFFNLLYERGHLIRQLTSADLSDTLTELYGRQYYLKQLNDEVSRARRLQKPVSVVKLAIDHFPEIEQSLGRGGRDQILRLVATVMQKSSRVNDICCRTNDNEFSMILPHSARKGASLRAERLRRLLEAHLMKTTPTPVSISAGVAEYPSHCSTFEDLEAVALQALEYIQSKGGNKVCLFQPDESFRPDFEVPPL